MHGSSRQSLSDSETPDQKPLFKFVDSRYSFFSSSHVFSSDSKLIAQAEGKEIYIFSGLDGTVIKILKVPSYGVFTGDAVIAQFYLRALIPATVIQYTFSANADFLFAENRNDEIIKFSLASGAVLKKIKIPSQPSSFPLIVSNNNQYLLRHTSDSKYYEILDLDSKPVNRLNTESSLVIFSADSKHVYAQKTGSFTIRVLNIKAKTWTNELHGAVMVPNKWGYLESKQSAWNNCINITSIEPALNDAYIVVGLEGPSTANSICILDAKTGNCLKELNPDSEYIFDVRKVDQIYIPKNKEYFVSQTVYYKEPDKKMVARDLHIWHLKTGELLGKFKDEYLSISKDAQRMTKETPDGTDVFDFTEIIAREQKKNTDARVANLWVLKCFMDLIADPDKLSVDILKIMLTKTKNIMEFRFSYTLANIELRQNPQHQVELSAAIYQCLERLAETCVVGPERDQKESSKTGSAYIAQYKLLLDSALEKGIISKQQKYYLDNLAEDHKTFSDKRFKELERQVRMIKEQVEINSKNIEILSRSLNDLKNALKAKAERDLYFGIAKVALTFIGTGAVDYLASLCDLSDFAEVGSHILEIEPKKLLKLMEQGITVVKDNMGSGAELAIKTAGYDPNEFVDTWTKTSIQLQTISSASTLAPPTIPHRSSSNTAAYDWDAAVWATPVSEAADTKEQKHKREAKQSATVIATTPHETKKKQSNTSIADHHAVMWTPTSASTRPQTTTLDNFDDDDPFPIHTAIQQNMSNDLISELLKTNVDINVKNTVGKTAVQLAAEKGNLACVQFLFTQGAKGNRLKCIQVAQEVAQSTGTVPRASY